MRCLKSCGHRAAFPAQDEPTGRTRSMGRTHITLEVTKSKPSRYCPVQCMWVGLQMVAKVPHPIEVGGVTVACGAAAAPLQTIGMPVEQTGVIFVIWQNGVSVTFCCC